VLSVTVASAVSGLPSAVGETSRQKAVGSRQKAAVGGQRSAAQLPTPNAQRLNTRTPEHPNTPAPSAQRPTPNASGPDFNRDVRPILSRHCFKCHGPDDKQRMAGLRLDLREAAVKPGPGGRRAIVPGTIARSELVRRIELTGGGVMPPAHTKNPLTAAQKDVLKRWVAAGAGYDAHWAFVPPKQPPLPKVKDAAWPRNPIDHFVLARLEAAGMKPSPQADPYTLVRRVHLDLIGIPPTPEEVDAFVTEYEAEAGVPARAPNAQRPTPDAYSRLVDRLLASPHYGERWARRWLDLARYADTNGYEKDRPRSVWPYRDWVINALNADMPFDRFTIEQLAGDMLPNATLEQRIATGFHRNTMLNEEGGIDPLEFRFHAMADRVATTGTAWLGLTTGCAQCHTHKFDPITQREYYQLFAFLNNADEPEIEVPRPDIIARRAELEKRITALEADLPNRFPAEEGYRWEPAAPAAVISAGGAKAEVLDDRSVRISGENPATDTYTVTFESDGGVAALRLEALTDPSLGAGGPGRTPHGNFVLSEVTVTAAPKDSPDQPQPVKLIRAEADFAQQGFPAPHAIDGNPKTGWAIHGTGTWNLNRTLNLGLEKPVPGPARWTVRLDQQHGEKHTLGRFRLSLGRPVDDPRPLEVRRKEHFERRFGEWLKGEESKAVRWTLLRPKSAKSNLPLLTILEDGSVLSSGDQTKRDVYDVALATELEGITAIRLEAIPDERLPKHGPGRIYYEGPHGDFHLSEISLAVGDKPVKLSGASQSFGTPAKNALDGNPQTGWSVNGGQGRPHAAVFNLAEPLDPAGELALSMVFERYYAAGLGRFRVWATSDSRKAEARVPPPVEEALLVPGPSRTAAQRELILKHFTATAPELASAREEITKLRNEMPAIPTTLVFEERPSNNPRPTRIHNRGEFLQARDQVEPGVLGVLHPLPKDAPRNRLTFARWLVDPRNPLVGRVTMNRQWAAFFGTGIVRTVEDFGYQGESPTHPDLLDWLAVEFVKQGWSLKRMHRLIVTSATYRQSSAVTSEHLAKDPDNRLLARAPRVRLEAEAVRDSALKIAGLLSPKIGGPSVFPPQPPGVTSEGTYGPLQWKVSEGEDRYRRGLYTFMKRTAPYAMTLTFDGPSGEACVARREVSNTPLQALTLLNDAVFLEAAQALGKALASRSGSVEERAGYLFRRCVARPPSPDELALITRYYHAQKKRFEAKELDAAALAGAGEGDVNERAAWTALARTLLNLDEVIARG
jgi:hypothetical protein